SVTSAAHKQDPLILHWDGAQWRAVPAGDLGANALLTGVAALRPDDAWAVGGGGTPDAVTPLIAHWDGHTWARRADAGDSGFLRGVVALAPDDAWAVSRPGLIRHWHGHAWTATPAATAVASGSDLYAVAAAAPDDVWAVGDSERT